MYYKRNQFVGLMRKLAAKSKLEENTTTGGQQPSLQPKKEGPSSQQGSPPSILMADVNLKSTAGAQGEMKPEIQQPDEMKPTSPFQFRGPDESMSAQAEAAAKEQARGHLGEAFEEFNAAHSQTQKDLKSIFDNYGANSAASSEQAKIGSARACGLLDELKKISARRR
jgi:hypothetical protein